LIVIATRKSRSGVKVVKKLLYKASVMIRIMFES
jgi:hypothetical protein